MSTARLSAVEPVKYRTIVADPPLDIAAGPRSLHDPHEVTRRLTYQTMPVDDIAALPVSELCHEDGAHLYLWTINKYVPDAYRIAAAWGFSPSTLLTWCKRPKGRGLGGAFGMSTEFVLFARRGSVASTGHVDSTWYQWPRGPHSVKPEAFMDMVEQVSPGPYLELFARRNRLGWDTWVNECLEHACVG